jgi:hypothetical protein
VDFGDESGIGDAFKIEDKIGGRFGHERIN